MLLPTPQELKTRYALDSRTREFIHSSRQTAKDIVTRKDPRLVIIVGPCSIHDPIQGLEYAKRFKELSERIDSSCFLIMRAYIEKARTLSGWKGLVYDPDLDESHDLEEGLEKARSFFIELAKMEVPVATEFLSPLVSPYIDDLVTWGFIGARTSASQIHREIASHLPFPVGFKNSLDGNVDTAIYGVISSRDPHIFFHVGEQGRLCKVKSHGNPYAHVVHRGSIKSTNYDVQSIQETVKKMDDLGLVPRLLVDCAHGNSQKDYEKQKEVFYSVLEQIEQGNRKILGMMLESHLKAGCQPLSALPGFLEEGISITDPCINWLETEELLLSIEESCSSLLSSSI
ncbi:MAG TPA: 3-deoxy-7-phosphoheptulonate synthase [Rhabdochlamydiaceae bacterium]|nr:3-deoxy-7-phosphoheptulonate synthase [Rhabdochlamydiaceae bacterium]